MKREDWDERYREVELVWSSEPNRFLVAEVADLASGRSGVPSFRSVFSSGRSGVPSFRSVRAPGRALDLACGEGRNAIWLAERGWQVSAVDFSSVAVAKAQQIAERRGVSVDWLVADVLEYRPRERFFDLVVLMYLHLPWPDMRAAIATAATAVAAGGVFLLAGHDRDNLEHGHGGPKDPAVLYSPEQVAGELHDFTIEKAERVRRRIEPRRDSVSHRHTGIEKVQGEPAVTPDSPLYAIDNLVRAVRPPASLDG